ncbi:MAG: hypothetical protein COS95_04365 [Ignavibacteriales bacterium CG07_land_8_20_14_0_80_59_12]|nr:MAG: hypothetical protein COS95_04365 [Ignavibacteriales bacterium CG07_land_8_20_14_0_80_59_12]
MKEARAIAPLCALLKDDRDSWVREESASALGEIGDFRAEDVSR